MHFQLQIVDLWPLSVRRYCLWHQKTYFQNLLAMTTKESLFMFNGSYYKQVDVVAMGSPLGPTLANAFMCHYEKVWLEECPSEFMPTFYRRYVDDIFVTF